MNLLGKIFTVLIFIMSLVFMSFAVAVYATHTNWKEKLLDPATGVKPQLTQQQELNRQLQAQVQELQNTIAKERAARVNALAALETKNLELQRQLTTVADEKAKLEAAHQVLVETQQNTQNMLAALTNEVQTLRDEVSNARQNRDEMFAQVQTLTDQLYQALGEQNRLQERHEQLLAQNADLERVLELNGLTAETPVAHIPPDVRGQVTDATGDFIEVSLGADDGIKRGHQLEVTRGSEYLGRLEVVSTKPDVSVARILRPYHQGPIRRGDTVRTKRAN